MGRGAGHGSPLLRHNQFVGVVGGNILNGEHLNKIVWALAGNGSGGGKADGGGLRIVATLLFHEHVVCLQRIVRGGQRRNGRTKRFLLLPTVKIRPGSAPSGVERVAGKGIPHAVETQDDRRRHQICAECSPLLRSLGPMSSHRCCGQFPNYPNIP